MSELDAGRLAQVNQPISTSAVGKLRSLGIAGRMATQPGGLEDVFAEVFAHIAQSKPVESIEPTGSIDDNPVIETQTLSQSDDESQQASDDKPSEERNSIANPLVNDPSDEYDLGPVEEFSDQHQVQDAEVEVEQDTSIPVAAVETEQVEADVVEYQVAEVVAQTATDDGGSDRRDRGGKDTKVSDAIAAPVEAEKTRSSRSNTDQQVDVAPTETVTDEDEFGQREAFADTSDQSRRVRGRRRVDRSDGPNETANQSRPREDALLRAMNAREAAESQAASVADSIEPRSVDAAAKSSRTAAPSVAVVAQSTANSARATAGHANSSLGNTGNARPTQSLESTTAPAAAKDQPKTKANQQNANTSETVSRVKLIQRVSKAFQHLGPEGGTVRLRLAPAELGSVRVEMRIQQRKIQARVVAETEAASSALREHLPELRQRLESQGMQIERLDVDVESGDHEPGDFRHQQPSQQQRSPWRQSSRRDEPATRSIPTVTNVSSQVSPSPLQPASAGGVDLRL